MELSKLIPICFVTVLAACTAIPAPDPGIPVTGDSTATLPSSQHELVGSIWQLVSFGSVGATNPVIGNEPITLEFELDGQAGGYGGCNSYGGPFTAQNDSLQFIELTGTLKACVDQKVTDQESQYLQALRSASRYEINGSELIIWYQNEGGILNFARTSATTPAPPSGDLPGQNAERIRFPTGDTGIEIFADVPARGSDSYVLHAEQGQIMSVEIISPNSDVLLEVVGEDGTPLKRYQNGPPSWTSQLPATQDYFIRAVSADQATAYTLHIWIEPVSSPKRERVQFDASTTSATRSGALAERDAREYVLSGSAGQNLHIQTVGYNGPVAFTLTGPTGVTILDSPAEPQPSDVYIFTAQVLLPDNGDYVVKLSVPSGAGATRYDVAFTIATGPLPTFPSAGEPPEQITLEPGTDSAQRSGLLPSSSALKQYVLTAEAGQTMTVDVISDDVALSLTITTPGGMQRIPETLPADGGGYHVGHEFTLSESGDYLVTLTKADQTPSTNYTATFTIK
jgi:heat shock protein HslJ